jgi:predicted RND superfamily exporter protein
LLSTILIILILLLLTRSLAYTLISILANLPPLGFLIIIFVIGDIDLNMTTSISLVVCLGLIVDDTIHILYRRVRLASPFGELGFGILTTSLILTGGFLSFLLSQSIPNQIFGVLCAVVFFFAAISDLAVFSWLADRVKPNAADITDS